MHVHNMRSPRTGNPVANQFIIEDDGGNEFFQSYQSIIAKRDAGGNIFLDEKYWNYSRTTAKYRNDFLEENTESTRKKVKTGEYVLVNLNK